MILTLITLLAIIFLLLLFIVLCVLVAIPIALMETFFWVVGGLILVGFAMVLDILLYPFKWFYLKLYPKKVEKKKEEESYY